MAVIAVVGSKGGVGKTTLAINLAAGLGRVGGVMLLDADPQRSAYQWSRIGEGPSNPPVEAEAKRPAERVSALAGEYAHVVVDCPPAVGAVQTAEALRVADVALVPVQPSPMDLWATTHIVEAIETARVSNPVLEARLVINQLERRTVLSRFARMAVEELGLDVARTPIHRRAVYRHCILEGKTVYEYGRRAGEAVQEMNALIGEVT